MAQPENVQTPSSVSSLASLVQILLFVALIVLIQIPLIYVAGSDSAHLDDPHPLDSVFDDQEHQQIMKKMLKDKEKYIIIEGQAQLGVVAFMKYFASQQKNRRTVLIREYIEDPYESAYNLFRFAKTLVEDQLNLEDDGPKTWILFAFQKTVPKEDITEIKKTHPLDKIIIVTSEENLKVRGFQTMIFPQITVEELQQAIQDEHHLTQGEADILTHHYETIPQILKNLNVEGYKIEKDIGDAYKPLDSLSIDEMSIVNKLCEKGQAKGKKKSQQLENVGVVFYKKKFYWQSDEARLNYEIQANEKCLNNVASDQILDLIYEEQKYALEEERKKEQAKDDEQAKAQQQPTEQEEEDEKSSKSKKKDKKKKKQVVQEEEEEEEEKKSKKEGKKEKKEKEDKKKDKKDKKDKKSKKKDEEL